MLIDERLKRRVEDTVIVKTQWDDVLGIISRERGILCLCVMLMAQRDSARTSFSIDNLLNRTVTKSPANDPNKQIVPTPDYCYSDPVIISDNTTVNDQAATSSDNSRCHTTISSRYLKSTINANRSLHTDNDREQKILAAGSTSTVRLDEKSISTPADPLPLWLNCAAAALPFEQSLLIAQRSGK